MNATFLVRDALLSDLGVITEFNRRLAFETEAKALDADTLSRGVRAAILDASRLRYWVVEREGAPGVIGQAAITREWSDWRNGWFWWLQSVYVRADVRGCGVFRSLYAHLKATASREDDVIGVRLYVEEANKAAQDVYRAVGMTAGGYHVYEEVWRG